MAILGAHPDAFLALDDEDVQNTSGKDLFILPSDMHYEISSYLPLCDLFSLRSTCETFKTIGQSEKPEDDLCEIRLSTASGGNLAQWSRANLTVAKRVLSHEPYLDKLAFNDVLRIWAAHPDILHGIILRDQDILEHMDNATILRMSLVGEDIAMRLIENVVLKQKLSIIEYLNLALRYKGVAVMLSQDRDAMREINEYYINSYTEKRTLNYDDLIELFKENPALELPDKDTQSMQAYFKDNPLFEGMYAPHIMGEYRRIKFSQNELSSQRMLSGSDMMSACFQPQNFYSMEIGEIKARGFCGDDRATTSAQNSANHPARCLYEEAIHIIYYVTKGAQLITAMQGLGESTGSPRP